MMQFTRGLMSGGGMMTRCSRGPISGADVLAALGSAAILTLLGGCGGDARLELSAADALGAVAGQMAGALAEYHREVDRYDASRESAAIAAFVARVQQDAGDSTALAEHTGAFETALARIRADRDVEFTRRAAATENVSVLREVSKGLQKLAIQSLGLEDEMKRYLERWIRPGGQNRASAGMSGAAAQFAAGTTGDSR